MYASKIFSVRVGILVMLYDCFGILHKTKKATDSLRGWVAFFTIVVSLLYTDSTGNSDLSFNLCFGCGKGGHADGHYNEGCGLICIALLCTALESHIPLDDGI